MRLIDADVFDKALSDAQAKCKRNGGNFRYGVLSNVRGNLSKAPTVDAVPVVHGAWVEHEDYNGNCYYSCSACGCDWMTIDGTPAENNMRFCPECGAKMDGNQ